MPCAMTSETAGRQSPIGVFDSGLGGLTVLRAEWSYLNRPDRLSELASRHLALGPVAPVQVGDIAALPARPVDGAVSAELDSSE